jgi:GT2 family glycosyltransferase
MVQSPPKISVVVVNYRSADAVERLVASVARSELAPHEVIVVDNASTDGTAELLAARAPRVETVRLDENLGSAGGFHAGLAAVYATGAEWGWIMDDDTIPTPTALERLLASDPPPGRPQPQLLVSKVVWSDGTPHPLNQPVLKRRADLYVEAAAHGLLPIRTATFPSLLVHRTAIERHGLPQAHYFIWGDDWEYSARILRDDPVGYLVPDSVAEHRTRAGHTAVASGGARYYFHARNWLYMMRSRSFHPGEKVSLAVWLAGSVLAYLRTERASPDSLRTLWCAFRDGLGPEPPRQGSNSSV